MFSIVEFHVKIGRTVQSSSVFDCFVILYRRWQLQRETGADPHLQLNPTANADVEIETCARHIEDELPTHDSDDPEVNIDDDIMDDGNSDEDNIDDEIFGTESPLEGLHIANLSFVFDQIHDKFDHHNPLLNCSFRRVIQTHSRRYGLKSQIFFRCQVCNYQDSIWTDRDDGETMSVNRSAVAGTMVTGIGFSQLEELLGSMGIKCMSPGTYRKYDMEMVAAFDKAAVTEMQQAAETAKQHALDRGDFIVHNGEKIPFVTVIADCAWMKRTYKTGKYDSLSGVAAIVEHHTRKVIFIGVRNKYCFVCEWAARHNVSPRDHLCYKNWGRDQASTGMETDAILFEFKTSMKSYGMIYKTLIADGDSNVYKSILDHDPYREFSVVVQKKECVNHLYRNLSRKITAVATTRGPSARLKQLVEGSCLKFRETIEAAVAHCQPIVEPDFTSRQRIDVLQENIQNALYHVFGDHRKCPEYCQRNTTPESLCTIDDLQQAGLFDQLIPILTTLSYHAESLIYHANNNPAEIFNAIVCKFIGGKRLNLGMRGSFQGRCAGAVLQYNTQSALSRMHISEGLKPHSTITDLEVRRQRKVQNNARIRQIQQAAGPPRSRKHQGLDKNYGPNAEKPDMSDEVFTNKREKLRIKLLEDQKNRVEVEKQTRGQAENKHWHSARKNLLTASNFGRVSRMRTTTSCSATVRSILYPSASTTSAMVYGRMNEPKAIAGLQEKLAEDGIEVTIRPCGLFIDRHLEYLAASPDGVIDDTTIVEVKCPPTATNYHPEDALQQRVTAIHKYFDARDRSKMNPSHHYYYQVQGQLHITESTICYFAVWTPLGVKYVKVLRDDDFWSQKMEPYLTRFYQECLIPEIVDGRKNRNMPIREPEYILAAKQSRSQAVGASKTGTCVPRSSTAVSDRTTTSGEDDALSVNTQDSERDSQGNRTIPVLKLIRSQADPDSWSVSSSDEQSESSAKRLKCSTEYKQTPTARILPRIRSIKILKRNTELGNGWCVSGSPDLESKIKSVSHRERSSATTTLTTSLPDQALTMRPPAPESFAERRENIPWVAISDYGGTEAPTVEEVTLLETLHEQASPDAVRTDILTTNSMLDDTSIDKFLSVIKGTNQFDTTTSLWLTHRNFIKSSKSSRDITIIGGNTTRHWRCLHFDGAQLFVYCSLGCDRYDKLSKEEIRFIELKYTNVKPDNVFFPVVQRQVDGTSCGVFAAAFATTIVLGGNPSHKVYSKDVMALRKHLLTIIESRKLSAFPGA